MVGKRLQQAREIAGLTQTTLAAEVGVSQSRISEAEKGARLPDEALSRVAEVTGFPLGFFSRAVGSDVHETVALRARVRLPAWRKKQVVRTGEVVLDEMRSMRLRFNTLPVRLQPMPDEPVPDAAVRTREILGFGPSEPALWLPLILEHAGVLVLGLPVEGGHIDALSDWIGDDAVVWLLATHAGDRQNWSIGHELGHLVMRSEDCGVADTFARYFLVPQEAALGEVDEGTTLQEYALLKRRWHISIQALIRSAFQYEQITKERYQGLFRQISARGERLRERLAVPPMKPRGFRKLAEELWGPSPAAALATDAAWSETMAEQVLSQHASADEFARRGSTRRSANHDNVVPLRPPRPGRSRT